MTHYTSFVAFDRAMARKISLGCDVFLMSSFYEPCGITQMESMSYATPALVRATGGLVDTVTPYDSPDGSGNGFVLDGATGEDILRNLVRSVEAARDNFFRKDQFATLQRNAFSKRFIWENSAEQYIERLYEAAYADPLSHVRTNMRVPPVEPILSHSRTLYHFLICKAVSCAFSFGTTQQRSAAH